MSELAKALVQAQSSVRAVAKSSSNDYHRYKYSAAEDVIDEAREALNSAGLALMTTKVEVLKADSAALVRSHYLLVHVSGETRECSYEMTAMAEKGRPWDKAESASATQSLAYFLRNLLLIKRGDEHAVDARDDRNFDPNGKREESVESKLEASLLWEEKTKQLLAAIGICNDVQELTTFAQQIAAANPPDKYLKKLRAAYGQRVKELSAASA